MIPDIPTTFAEKVKFYRTKLGLTQHQIPGFSHTMISRYESGQNTPTSKNLIALANIFGVAPDELIDPTPEKLKALRNQSYQMARDLLAQGHPQTAFEYGRQFSRLAYKTGDADAMDQAVLLMKEIMSQLTETEVVESACRTIEDPLITEKLQNLAFLRKDWPLALLLNGVLAHRFLTDSVDHGRVLRNRARIQYGLGHCEAAWQWFEHTKDLAQWNIVMQCVQEMSQANVGLFAGRPSVEHPRVQRYVTESRVVWSLYWWYECHAAWHAEDWPGLRRTYQAALNSFQPEWPTSELMGLASIESVLRWKAGGKNALDRLRHVLHTPNLDDVAGDGTYQDLINDWIHLVMQMDHPDASREWASHVHWLHLHRMDGWVAYFLTHRPERIEWQTLSLNTAKTVQTLLQHPPEPYCDPLFMNTFLVTN